MKSVLVGLVVMLCTATAVSANDDQKELESNKESVELFKNLARESLEPSALSFCNSWPTCDSPDVKQSNSTSRSKEDSERVESETH